MNRCIDCSKWNAKSTDKSMLRLGFAACKAKDKPGYTVSSQARSCDKFDALDAEKVKARVVWLDKKKG